ncbi:hypothetical protein BDZ85DRAFT_257031 [Elsinoe ampelina]|uniref:Uncharacterized protein n=1 Tax=Elsinoe ampelina TaxID=302913 RepID=A0A6A6GMQ4_9PEZI|nr:hypothetical protein BDZ85DRAFT_257031 [Elsinoe ampelina]
MASTSLWNTTASVVLDDASLIRVLESLVKHATSSSTLVVCSSKDDFMHFLYNAIVTDNKLSKQHGTADQPIDIEMNDPDFDEDEADRSRLAEHPLLQPTLYMLFAASKLKVAFCPSTPHTLAYLASLPLKRDSSSTSNVDSPGPPLLAVLNPITQHDGTRSYSAQGLTRFFAAAVSTAHDLGARLIIAECRVPQTPRALYVGDLFAEAEDATNRQATPSPWDEQIPITNVKAKGAASREIGWQGRTVSIREVAGKWCEFVES